MKFCVNCGKEIKGSPSICPSCSFDPNIPEEIINESLEQIFIEKKEKELASRLEYPGESSSLAFSIFMMIILALFFSTISLGLFIIYLILSLVLHRIREYQTKSQLERVSENNFPNIFKLSKLASYRLKISPSPVYVISKPSLNAYTSGFWGNHWIVLHSALVKILKSEEVLYVLGHEMGHIKREHATWLSLISTRMPRSIPLISSGLRIIFNNWHIKSEYSADRAGIVANGNLDSCISALSMITLGHRKIELESILEESEKYRQKRLSHLGELIRTHPYYPNRIRQLNSFYRILDLK